MMRILRISITLIFIVTCVVFGYYWYTSEVLADKTVPVIEIEGDVLNVRLTATDGELLQGVSAYDEKDGDLTDNVIVESISKFSEKGVCKVTYAVCDSDNHVASATRKITYNNYTSPKFSMNRSLCFSTYETVDVAEVMCAEDVIDGDISDNIIITSTDYEYGTTGSYNVNAKVTNSKGDMVTLDLPLIVEERNVNAPEIVLSDYLIYVEKGTVLDYNKYFVSATDSYNQDVSESLHIESNYDKNGEGLYSVHYYVTDGIARQGHTILTVIVG